MIMTFIRALALLIAGTIAFAFVIWFAYLALLAASSGNLY